MSASGKAARVERRRRFLARALLAALGVAAVGAAAPAPKAPPPAAAARRSVLADRPGYVPLVDPESMSVVLGRRTSAPLVSMPFRGGARSLTDLGRTICRHLHHAERDSLLQLCVSADEFRHILWREFPQSRPAVGLTWEDAWKILYARQRSGCLEALGDHGHRFYEFVRFEHLARPDSITPYKNFRTHNGLVMVVRNDQGELERWTWLRSVAERRGVFKIYSTTD